MTPSLTNGASGARPPVTNGFELSKPASPPLAIAVTVRVEDLPTDIIHTPADNEIDMEVVDELKSSMTEHGQYVDIIVYPQSKTSIQCIMIFASSIVNELTHAPIAMGKP
jgi:hypothetical protein